MEHNEKIKQLENNLFIYRKTVTRLTKENSNLESELFIADLKNNEVLKGMREDAKND